MHQAYIVKYSNFYHIHSLERKLQKTSQLISKCDTNSTEAFTTISSTISVGSKHVGFDNLVAEIHPRGKQNFVPISITRSTALIESTTQCQPCPIHWFTLFKYHISVFFFSHLMTHQCICCRLLHYTKSFVPGVLSGSWAWKEENNIISYLLTFNKTDIGVGGVTVSEYDF